MGDTQNGSGTKAAIVRVQKRAGGDIWEADLAPRTEKHLKRTRVVIHYAESQ